MTEHEAEVVVHGDSAGVTVPWVQDIVVKTLALERRGPCRVGVLLTGDREIRRINKEFLAHDYATDVIAFGLDEAALLGDIVVSVQRAKAVSGELGIPFKEELARYLVHGTLHLLGYEDKPKRNHDRMHRRQEDILLALGRAARRARGRRGL